MNPILLTDYYKTEHYRQYPENTTMIYSNFTPRKSRMQKVDKIVFFGLQHFILKYLIGKFNKEFFQKPFKEVVEEYLFAINTDISHVEQLHKLGYLPIKIKALPEGTLCPIGVPCFTIRNTHPNFGWLTNYLETLISCQMWQPITSATIANEYRKLLSKYAIETTGNNEFVQWQGHDFSMRGMSSIESAILSGMGHLTSFTGTDTIPAIYALKSSYNATGLIGASVPATEHSVMCMGQKESEIETFKRLLDLYPKGILSVVSDTWDLWKVCTEYLPALKDKILARDGKLVIRPDSGDPVDIICGRNTNQYTGIAKDGSKWYEVSKKSPQEEDGYDWHGKEVSESEVKGVIELLWDVFGGKINEYGYKELDPHIGAIYGDSITFDRARDICDRLKAKGFASTNIVFGIGSYTYQYNTRDTFGFAMKATYGEVLEETNDKYQEGDQRFGDNFYRPIGREIFKAPITDSGEKKSAKGLLAVMKTDKGLELKQQCTWKEESEGELVTIFENSKLIKSYTLDEIRERIKNYDTNRA